MQGAAGSPCSLGEGWEKVAAGVVQGRGLEIHNQGPSPTGWEGGILPSELEPPHLMLHLSC